MAVFFISLLKDMKDSLEPITDDLNLHQTKKVFSHDSSDSQQVAVFNLFMFNPGLGFTFYFITIMRQRSSLSSEPA